MFNNMSTALESTYKDYFFNKLKSVFQISFDLTQAIRRLQNTEQIDKQISGFLVGVAVFFSLSKFILLFKKKIYEPR
jgi:hypothetical protein